MQVQISMYCNVQHAETLFCCIHIQEIIFKNLLKGRDELLHPIVSGLVSANKIHSSNIFICVTGKQFIAQTMPTMSLCFLLA